MRLYFGVIASTVAGILPVVQVDIMGYVHNNTLQYIVLHYKYMYTVCFQYVSEPKVIQFLRQYMYIQYHTVCSIYTCMCGEIICPIDGYSNFQVSWLKSCGTAKRSTD